MKRKISQESIDVKVNTSQRSSRLCFIQCTVNISARHCLSASCPVSNTFFHSICSQLLLQPSNPLPLMLTRLGSRILILGNKLPSIHGKEVPMQGRSRRSGRSGHGLATFSATVCEERHQNIYKQT